MSYTETLINYVFEQYSETEMEYEYPEAKPIDTSTFY